MSADNYTYVGRVNEQQFGIWTNCNASVDGVPQRSPDIIVSDPAQAIVTAHAIERDSGGTEYGVALGRGVLEAAEKAVEDALGLRRV